MWKIENLKEFAKRKEIIMKNKFLFSLTKKINKIHWYKIAYNTIRGKFKQNIFIDIIDDYADTRAYIAKPKNYYKFHILLKDRRGIILDAYVTNGNLYTKIKSIYNEIQNDNNSDNHSKRIENALRILNNF